MNFKTYIRRPFEVRAIQITSKNLDEVAKFIGDVKEDETGSKYILVDQRLVPNVEKVYPGFFMTKMRNNVRCYSRRVFFDQFVEMDDDIKELIDLLNDEEEPETEPEVGNRA